MVSQKTSGVKRTTHSSPTIIVASDWNNIVPTGYLSSERECKVTHLCIYNS
jgi:hypothetical protein